MHQRIPSVAAAALCLALVSSSDLRGQTREPGSNVEDAVFAGLVKPDEPGFAVLLRHGGRNGFKRTEGVRDQRSKAKIGALITTLSKEKLIEMHTAIGFALGF